MWSQQNRRNKHFFKALDFVWLSSSARISLSLYKATLVYALQPLDEGWEDEVRICWWIQAGFCSPFHKETKVPSGQHDQEWTSTQSHPARSITNISHKAYYEWYTCESQVSIPTPRLQGFCYGAVCPMAPERCLLPPGAKPGQPWVRTWDWTPSDIAKMQDSSPAALMLYAM